MAWTLSLGILLALLISCGGEEPTAREVEMKTEVVGEKTAAIAFMSGFGRPGECRDILDKDEDDIEEAIEKIEDYDGDSNRRRMSLLEDAEKALDKLGEELEDKNCI